MSPMDVKRAQLGLNYRLYRVRKPLERWQRTVLSKPVYLHAKKPTAERVSISPWL
jgi:hypothetical protein